MERGENANELAGVQGRERSHQENLDSPDGAMLTTLAFHGPPLRAQVVASATARQGNAIFLGSVDFPRRTSVLEVQYMSVFALAKFPAWLWRKV